MYYLYMKQRGEGCDYTIGCGSKLFSLDADTLEEAKEEAKQYFDGENYGYGRGDHALSDAMILKYEADALSILNEILDAEDEEAERLKKEKQERLEKAEFERLSKKFGK